MIQSSSALCQSDGYARPLQDVLLTGSETGKGRLS